MDPCYPALPVARRPCRVTITESMPEDWNFEQGLTDLESVVKELESGDLPLEKAIQVFERGVTLSDRCRKELEDAETRVEILLKRGDKTEAEPFDPTKE
jgi:exodeoxyribonuclease VII small subunit